MRQSPIGAGSALPYLSVTRAGSRAVGGNVAMFPRGLFAGGVPSHLRVSGRWPVIRITFINTPEPGAKRLTWRGSHWQASLPLSAIAVPRPIVIQARESRAFCHRVGPADYAFDFAPRAGLPDAALREGAALLHRLEELARCHPGLEQALGLPIRR